MYRSTRRLPAPVIGPDDVVPMPDRGGMLSSLEAVRREVLRSGDMLMSVYLFFFFFFFFKKKKKKKFFFVLWMRGQILMNIIRMKFQKNLKI